MAKDKMSSDEIIRNLEEQLIELKMELASAKTSEDHLKLELFKMKTAFEQISGENDDLRSQITPQANKQAQIVEISELSIGATLRLKTKTQDESSHKRLTHGIPSCASGIAFLSSALALSNSQMSLNENVLQSEELTQSDTMRIGNTLRVKTKAHDGSTNKSIVNGDPASSMDVSYWKGNVHFFKSLVDADETEDTDRMSLSQVNIFGRCPSGDSMTTMSADECSDDSNSQDGRGVDEGCDSSGEGWGFFSQVDA